MMKKQTIILLIATLGIVTNTIAQNTDTLKTLNLSEVNVVGARIERPNLQSPASISVITSSQIQQAGYASVADALSDAAGIYITGTGQVPGANESIFMRGANSNQTVILVDGIRISDASTVNNTADLSELSISNVDRIEIIRGSQSTLYGSGAVGGIVSITTKESAKKGIHGNVSAAGGTFGKGTADIRGNAKLACTFRDGIYLASGIEKNMVTGTDATTDTVTNPSVYKNRDKDNWDKTYYFAKAGFRTKNFNGDLHIGTHEMKTDLDKGAYTDDDNYTLDFKRNMLNGKFGWESGNLLSSQLSVGYTDTKRHSRNDSSLIDHAGTYDHYYFEDTYSGKNVSGDWLLNAHFSNADLLAGISGISEDMNQENFISSSGVYESRTKLDSITPVNSISAYLHAQVNGSGMKQHLQGAIGRFFSLLNLSGGIRISNHSLSGSQLAYDISLSMRTSDESQVYLTRTTGYNNPSLYQLYAPEKYIPYDGNLSTGLTLGNRDLKPESAGSFEIGYKQSQGSSFQYAVSFFHTVTKDLIEYVYLWDKSIGIDTLGNDPFNRDDYRGDRYLNIGKQTTSGIEIDLQAFLSSKLIVSANASLVSGKIEYSTSASIESQTNGTHVQLYSTGAFLDARVKEGSLVRRPSEANLKMIYSPVEKLQFIPSLRFVTARNDIYYDGSLGPYGALAVNTVDSYVLTGLAINWKPCKGLHVNLRGENLLNEKYEEIHGFTTRRRSVYATIGYSF